MSAPLAQHDRFARDVADGLTRSPKSLPSKYFYDARGSALFERICAEPEYYLTRAELAIMREQAPAIAEVVGSNVLLFEYGSGSAIKTRLLLEHLSSPAGYVPIEIAPAALAASVAALHAALPALEILPLGADFSAPLALPQPRMPPKRNVAYFPGSTIGNLETADAIALLRKMREEAGRGGGALIGIDLAKDPAILEAAYNDATGVTAQFTLNLLVRINRELGADFDLGAFEHRARWSDAHGRIETSIVSQRRQVVHVAGIVAEFGEGEAMAVEISCKYTLAEFERMASAAGWRVAAAWFDPEHRFSLQYLSA